MTVVARALSQTAAANKEGFDYTEWRKTGLPQFESVEELSRAAMKYSKTLRQRSKKGSPLLEARN